MPKQVNHAPSAPNTQTTKISTCLPTTVWNRLVETLRSPYSRAEPGKLDRGVLSEWILEQALSTVANAGLHNSMLSFIESKELQQEFEEYFKASANSKIL
jgi:hypothetical protein